MKKRFLSVVLTFFLLFTCCGCSEGEITQHDDSHAPLDPYQICALIDTFLLDSNLQEEGIGWRIDLSNLQFNVYLLVGDETAGVYSPIAASPDPEIAFAQVLGAMRDLGYLDYTTVKVSLKTDDENNPFFVIEKDDGREIYVHSFFPSTI